MSVILERKRIAERLAQRDSTTLAAFIMTLIDDEGPFGEYVRTFIAADNAQAAVSMVKENIDALRHHQHRPSHRRRRDLELTDRAERLLDAIEYVVLPLDSAVAFELLAQFIECDGPLCEGAHDVDFEIELVIERAIRLLLALAEGLPEAQVQSVLERLRAKDDYGLRGGLG